MSNKSFQPTANASVKAVARASYLNVRRTREQWNTLRSRSSTRYALYSLVLTVTVAVGACGAPEAPSPSSDTDNRSFEFALISDNPYSEKHVSRFESMIEDINQDSGLEWVLHLGDIKGGQPCTDELFQARFDLYQRFQAGFIFTPGDNEWFDCSSVEAGDGHEYERLAFLRQLFFPEPGQTTGGRRFAVESQSQDSGFEEFVENSMWVRENIVFSTFHLISLTRLPTDPVVAKRRMDAALAWIEKTFQLAEQLNSPAVFLATQVDPWVVSRHRVGKPRAGIERLYPVLESETIRFGRPVVLAVGDTHVFRVDKPMYSAVTGQLVENFTRVEPFGSPSIHWVRVMADANRTEVFSFREELVEANLAPVSQDEPPR